MRLKSEVTIMEAHQKIKMIRKTLGLSQEEFAKKINMKQRNYSYLENGQYELSYKILRSIIETYDVNLCWFWYGKGEMFCK